MNNQTARFNLENKEKRIGPGEPPGCKIEPREQGENIGPGEPPG